MYDSLAVAQRCAAAAEDKKAYDIRILDLRGLTSLTDFFVICSGSNVTQLGAVADGIGRALAVVGIRPSHIEGGADATWILMDYGDVVVHIFDEATRVYYSLEKLWGDAPRMPLDVSRELHGATP